MTYYSTVLDGLNHAMANSIRRFALSDVPALAFHRVTFLANTSHYPDSFLAHRFAMIPVAGKASILEPHNTCCGSHCTKCAHVCHLDVKNDTLENRPVRWGDIKTPAEVKILFPSEQLCILGMGAHLKCEAYIMRGTHRQHGKWAVTSAFAMRPERNIQLFFPSYSSTTSDIEQVIATCPNRVFGKTEGKLTVLDPVRCNSCMKCVERYPGQISVTNHHDPRRFAMKLESIGTLPAAEIFRQSITGMIARLLEMKSLV